MAYTRAARRAIAINPAYFLAHGQLIAALASTARRLRDTVAPITLAKTVRTVSRFMRELGREKFRVAWNKRARQLVRH
jgi:hypothetical protein